MNDELLAPIHAMDPSPINPGGGQESPWPDEPVGPDGIIDHPDDVTDNPDVIDPDTPLVPS
ncbi:hypothetical protein EGJ52_13885 [Pseudomonas luteola]|uniref:hypothetical protein n=1 Tax=Pseudomonas TaxID=286 RepID=UPI000F7900B4|nr:MULTISPECIES: hypothetical protein [Pseudomonas]RRW43702.1 hypothetical protein EGJ52_13885 [Pseudomonas luteola]